MTTDKSYTPISSAFDDVLCAYFPATMTPAQMQALKKMFFAGAAVTYDLMKHTPGRAETMKEEIAGYADHLDVA